MKSENAAQIPSVVWMDNLLESEWWERRHHPGMDCQATKTTHSLHYIQNITSVCQQQLQINT